MTQITPHPALQPATLRWTAADLATLAQRDFDRAPVLGQTDVVRIGSDLDVWDAWPLADNAGNPVSWRGGELWFALAAPALDDPEERHGKARIHTFHHVDGAFHHMGPTLPDGFSPGTREWSGSARIEGDEVALYFTAAGARDEDRLSYRQRLFVTRLHLGDGEEIFKGWSEPRELLAPGSGPYLAVEAAEGTIGEIKAFRDPFPWDLPDGRKILLFTASSKADPGPFNGMVGMALAGEDGTYNAVDPLIDAVGTNNELERPHLVAANGRIYLFWSTQAKVFAPGCIAPTGLYGAVADNIEGTWQLLNGDGLIFANPVNEPFQTYSWWVMPDLRVTSFVDYWGVDDPAAEAKPHGRAHFGGTFAPFLHLTLDGATAGLA
ncbi:glycoside hydrolase family 68 protein [Croceicoccus ponticola]|uniref:Glycoside hydrolase family 68 protein n=1 Tax=Croceicoccus ponticola TaxID=2217664 RepID=A0A437GZL4_9SPHN|nr:glycoside hydrolase family 68 protein [Croceicoccus ponticola]RVQ68811.1 glycoside hydrolase family 68 protein [Croceicoccus ponticola]